MSAPVPPSNRSFPARPSSQFAGQVADKLVVEVVAVAVEIAEPIERQPLDIVRKRVRDGRDDRVVSLVRGLQYLIAAEKVSVGQGVPVLDGVDVIRVIAQPADHNIRASAADQHIVPCETLEALGAHAAVQKVVEAVAVAIKTAADEPQLFHVVGQHVSDGRSNRVVSLVRGLQYLIAAEKVRVGQGVPVLGGVDVISVVTLTANHYVGADAAVEQVLASTAK